MRREWEPEDLIGSWTLVEPDWELVANKTGVTRLGFSVLLKFFEIDGRFPEYAAEVPERAVVYLAEQVGVDPALFAKYEFSSRAAKYHRVQIREELGFRECTKADQAVLAEWLSRELCPAELRREQLRDAVIARCRAERMEPPRFGQIARLVNSAVRKFEERFCRATEDRLDGPVLLKLRRSARCCVRAGHGVAPRVPGIGFTLLWAWDCKPVASGNGLPCTWAVLRESWAQRGRVAPRFQEPTDCCQQASAALRVRSGAKRFKRDHGVLAEGIAV